MSVDFNQLKVTLYSGRWNTESNRRYDLISFHLFTEDFDCRNHSGALASKTKSGRKNATKKPPNQKDRVKVLCLTKKEKVGMPAKHH